LQNSERFRFQGKQIGNSNADQWLYYEIDSPDPARIIGRKPNNEIDAPLPKKRITTALMMACCSSIRRFEHVVMIDNCMDSK